MTLVTNTWRCAAAAAAVGMAACLFVAVLGVEPAVRSVLDLRFDPAPASFAATLSIAANNGRIAGAALLCATIYPYLGRPAQQGCDLLLGFTLVVNAATVGVALGAYRERAALALLPHLPLEAAALALCGGVFLAARNRPMSGAEVLGAGGLAAVLLLCAAVLETTLNLGAGS